MHVFEPDGWGLRLAQGLVHEIFEPLHMARSEGIKKSKEVKR
jgi:hypothetical protein